MHFNLTLILAQAESEWELYILAQIARMVSLKFPCR